MLGVDFLDEHLPLSGIVAIGDVDLSAGGPRRSISPGSFRGSCAGRTPARPWGWGPNRLALLDWGEGGAAPRAGASSVSQTFGPKPAIELVAIC